MACIYLCQTLVDSLFACTEHGLRAAMSMREDVMALQRSVDNGQHRVLLGVVSDCLRV